MFLVFSTSHYEYWLGTVEWSLLASNIQQFRVQDHSCMLWVEPHPPINLTLQNTGAAVLLHVYGWPGIHVTYTSLHLSITWTLGHFCVGWTSQYHMWCNVVLRIMTVIKYGLQCLVLVRGKINEAWGSEVYATAFFYWERLLNQGMDLQKLWKIACNLWLFFFAQLVL